MREGEDSIAQQCTCQATAEYYLYFLRIRFWKASKRSESQNMSVGGLELERVGFPTLLPPAAAMG